MVIYVCNPSIWEVKARSSRSHSTTEGESVWDTCLYMYMMYILYDPVSEDKNKTKNHITNFCINSLCDNSIHIYNTFWSYSALDPLFSSHPYQCPFLPPRPHPTFMSFYHCFVTLGFNQSRSLGHGFSTTSQSTVNKETGPDSPMPSLHHKDTKENKWPRVAEGRPAGPSFPSVPLPLHNILICMPTL